MQAQSHAQAAIAPASSPVGLPVHYANYFRVSGAPGELLVDLGVVSQGAAAKAGAEIPCERRIAMSPFTAKRLLGALGAAMKHYEQIFGCIDIDDHHSHDEKKHAPYGDQSKSAEVARVAHAAPEPAAN